LRPVVTEGVRRLLGNPQYGFYVVAETGGEIIGCLMVTYEWSDWRCGVVWWIQSLYVKTDFRRQGVFRKLYEFTVEKASRDSNVCGLRVYVVKSNQAAQCAYAKIGMEETYYKVYEAVFEK
jgi:GNAT superfamily N-acetyltransferase